MKQQTVYYSVPFVLKDECSLKLHVQGWIRHVRVYPAVIIFIPESLIVHAHVHVRTRVTNIHFSRSGGGPRAKSGQARPECLTSSYGPVTVDRENTVRKVLNLCCNWYNGYKTLS